jgi:hypothetical protein
MEPRQRQSLRSGIATANQADMSCSPMPSRCARSPLADPSVVYVDLSVTEEDEAEFGDEYGRSFRCVVGEIAAIESNLSIANMDFTEFADYADSHGGVFRGFED